MADSEKSGGITLCMILFILFLVLKLTGTIAWSWWWVTAPLWIPVALIVLFFVLAAAVALVIIGAVFVIALVVAFLERR